MALRRHSRLREQFNRNPRLSTSHKTDPKSPWRDCMTDRILYFEGRLGERR